MRGAASATADRAALYFDARRMGSAVMAVRASINAFLLIERLPDSSNS